MSKRMRSVPVSQTMHAFVARVVLLACAVCVPASAQDVGGGGSETRFPATQLDRSFTPPPGASWGGRLIVEQDRRSIAANDGVAIVDPDAGPHRQCASRKMIRSISVPPHEDPRQYAERLLASGVYTDVQPDWVVRLQNSPNDTRFAQQWHHDALRSAQAWGLQTGDPSLVIAFADSGVQTGHPDLSDLLLPGHNGVQRLAQSEGGDVEDTIGHGTSVIGVATARGNNGFGVAGVGWGFRVMPLKVTFNQAGEAFTSDIVESARWAAANGADIISVSFSGVQQTVVAQLGAELRAQDKLLVWGAGNDSSYLSINWADVITVGATDQNDQRWAGSNFGPGVDLVAPGVDIYTTRRSSGFINRTGTSVSTPIVSAAAGLIWSVDRSMSADEVESILMQSVRDLGRAGPDDDFGAGIVDLYQAVLDAHALFANQAPRAERDSSFTLRDEAIEIPVLLNDSDANLDPVGLHWHESQSAEGGVVEMVPESQLLPLRLRYTPPSGFVGSDTFTYRVTDGVMVSDATPVEVEVRSVSSAIASVPLLRPIIGQLETSFYSLSRGPIPTPLNGMSVFPVGSGVWQGLQIPATSGAVAGSPYSDTVGILFEGFLYAPYTGMHRLVGVSDDSCLIEIAGQEVVRDLDNRSSTDGIGLVALEQGWHPVRVTYYEAGGLASLETLIGKPTDQPMPIGSALLATEVAPCVGADTAEPSSVLDAFDVLAQLSSIDSVDLSADLAPFGRPDGTIDRADVDLYLELFALGCD